MDTDVIGHLKSYKRLLSVKELAAILHVSQKTVYNLVSNRDIPYLRVGAIRFDGYKVAEWVKTKTV